MIPLFSRKGLALFATVGTVGLLLASLGPSPAGAGKVTDEDLAARLDMPPDLDSETAATTAADSDVNVTNDGAEAETEAATTTTTDDEADAGTEGGALEALLAKVEPLDLRRLHVRPVADLGLDLGVSTAAVDAGDLAVGAEGTSVAADLTAGAGVALSVDL